MVKFLKEIKVRKIKMDYSKFIRPKMLELSKHIDQILVEIQTQGVWSVEKHSVTSQIS